MKKLLVLLLVVCLTAGGVFGFLLGKDGTIRQVKPLVTPAPVEETTETGGLNYDAIYALHPGFGMRFAILAVENVLFTCGVVLMLKKLRIGNVLLRFLGGISLEFYVLQGLMLLLFRSGLIRIADDLSYAAAVIASTTALAALIHPLYAAAVRRYRQSIEK